MLKLYSSARKIDTVFIVCLFALFALTAFVLILIGVRQYQSTADSMNDNYEVRTAISYLSEKVRQYDTDAGITVADFYGGQALALSSYIEDKTYITFIYYYDGALREILVGEDAVYSPESGQSVIELNGFTAEYVHSGLIRATITDTDGITHDIYLKIHATSGRGVS